MLKDEGGSYMYITYEEYENFGGTLDDTTFEQIYYQAKSFVDWVTFDRLVNEETFSDEVKRCMFDLINMLYNKQLALTPNATTSSAGTEGTASVTEMSNDGVTVKYNVMSSSELFEVLKPEIMLTISRYLANQYNSLGRKLLYRGLYCDE